MHSMHLLVEALEHPGTVSKLYVDDAMVMSIAATPTEAVQGPVQYEKSVKSLHLICSTSAGQTKELAAAHEGYHLNPP